MRRPSNAARDLIVRREGKRLRAYQDSAGVWTIGYGHTARVYAGMVITDQQADDLLMADMLEAVRTIYANIPAAIVDGWPQACFDAMVSFVFNVGAQAFTDPRTGQRTNFYRACVGADLLEVARQMQRWVKAGGRVLPGLVARRGEEAALWGAGVATLQQPPQHAVSVVEDELASAQPDMPPPARLIQQPGMVAGAASGAAGVAAAAATLSGAGTSMTMSGDRIVLLIGLALVLLGAGVMIWLARRG